MADYEANLRGNLRDLASRLKRHAYRPLPSLRCEIPKGKGKTRTLGIATLEDKIVRRAERGVPQGSCLSPLLANVYLHYVLDLWFSRVVVPRLRGEAYLRS
jgi:retron-type reverse transcriptase